MQLDQDVVLLIGLLARGDALYVPHRHTPSNQRAARALDENRQEFHAHGLPMIGGGSAAERQDHSRMLSRLRQSGLVVVSGHIRPRVRLTTATDDKLRALTACPTVHSAWPLLKLVKLLANGSSGPVLEFDVLGASPSQLESKDLVGLENLALPLLVRGFLLSDSDMKQRLGYFITEDGCKALAAGRPAFATAMLPDFDPAAGDLYDAEFRDAMAERAKAAPVLSNNVVIPLSAGSWEDCPQPLAADKLRKEIGWPLRSRRARHA